MRKISLFLIAAIGIIVFSKIATYAVTISFINAAPPAATETRSRGEVDEAVRRGGGGTGSLGSNMTLLTPEIADRILSPKVRVDMVDISAARSVVATPEALEAAGVTRENLKNYAVGLGALRLAGVAERGGTYYFSDTTVNPVLFKDDFVEENREAFAAAVTDLPPNSIAVIVLIRAPREEIVRIITEVVPEALRDKVTIVEASTPDSKNAFSDLFSERGQGFNLRDLDRNSPTVIKAIAGAV